VRGDISEAQRERNVDVTAVLVGPPRLAALPPCQRRREEPVGDAATHFRARPYHSGLLPGRGHWLIVAVTLLAADDDPRQARRGRGQQTEPAVTRLWPFRNRDHSGHQNALADCARREMNVTFPSFAEGAPFVRLRSRPLIAICRPKRALSSISMILFPLALFVFHSVAGNVARTRSVSVRFVAEKCRVADLSWTFDWYFDVNQ